MGRDDGPASRRGSRARTPLRWDGRRREDGGGFRVLAVETGERKAREGGRKQDDKEWKRERRESSAQRSFLRQAREEWEQFVRPARGGKRSWAGARMTYEPKIETGPNARCEVSARIHDSMFFLKYKRFHDASLRRHAAR